MRAGLRSDYKGYVVVAVALTMVAAGPAPIRALSSKADSAMRFTPFEHTLRLRLTPGADGMTRAEHRISRDVMAYSIRVEGATSENWTVSLTVRGTFPGVVLQLRGDAPEITLPRPLGLSLRVADSLFVLATFEGWDGGAVTLVIQHEPVEGAAARLPIHPVRAQTRGVHGDTTSAWHFTATVSGRVLAITGLPMQRVRAMALVDAASGETLWSTSVDQSAAAAYRPSTHRLGAVIEAGRTYRVQVVFKEAANIGATAVVAMVLPIR